MDHDKSETIPMSPIIAINNFHRKKPAWFYQRRKYRFSQLHKISKKYMRILQTTPMCEILGQSHWCSQDSISRIKIPISNTQVPNIKNLPQKVLTTDMRDSKSWIEILIITCLDQWKVTTIFFTHKDLFTIKILLIKFIVYDKLSIKKRTATVP